MGTVGWLAGARVDQTAMTTLARIPVTRYPQEPLVDPTWPRRKKSDLMGHMMPQYKYKRVAPERAPESTEHQEKEVEIKIKRQARARETPEKKVEGWPRRKKSDLLIYQVVREQTRNL